VVEVEEKVLLVSNQVPGSVAFLFKAGLLGARLEYEKDRLSIRQVWRLDSDCCVASREANRGQDDSLHSFHAL
jgi:hypothetical protein